MIYKNLGNTQTTISAIGQGSIGAGSHSSTTPEKIRTRIQVILSGIEEDITFLDTGEDYEDGHAEEVLGKAVKGLRGRVFISSKFKPVNNTSAGVLKAAEMSLKRLKTDYIDLYQIQWPNPQVPLSETLKAMMKLVEQGKVRFLGVSNFTYAQLKEARELSGEKIVSIQTEYNLLNRDIEKEILPYCESTGLMLIAYSPLSRWNLSLREHEIVILNGLCKKYTATIPQIFLNWLISRKNIAALTQTMSVEHIRENGRAANFILDQADMEEMNRAFFRESVLVPTERIRVLNYDVDETHRIYITLEDALKNKMNIQPSPVAIAEELKQGSMLKPVELVTSGDKSGYYDYDLTHGRMRYWAWIIAYGREVPIPAYIINDRNKNGDF
ncbi:MAG: aldo/keto reductase [Candidatus Omnitrophota bacterium]